MAAMDTATDAESATQAARERGLDRAAEAQAELRT